MQKAQAAPRQSTPVIIYNDINISCNSGKSTGFTTKPSAPRSLASFWRSESPYAEITMDRKRSRTLRRLQGARHRPCPAYSSQRKLSLVLTILGFLTLFQGTRSTRTPTQPTHIENRPIEELYARESQLIIAFEMETFSAAKVTERMAVIQDPDLIVAYAKDLGS